jgi:acetyl esterase
LLRLDDLFHESDLRGLSPPAARRRVEGSVMAVGPARRRDVSSRELRLDGPVCALPSLLYEPPGAANPSPLVVYYHGGGWVTGSPGSHDGLCRELCAGARVRVVSVSYRLAPEAPFPAAVDDSLAAFREIAGRARELGVDPRRIAVMGDSAGGNLSAVISQKTRNDEIRPALQVLLYPALDGTLAEASHVTYADGWFLTRPMIDWYYDHYAGSIVDRAHPDLSPLFVERPEGLPATRVYTAGFDPLVDEGRLYAERLLAAGVPAVHRSFDHLIHGFALMTGAVRAARRAVDQIIEETAEALHA